METHERRIMACEAAIEAWLNVASPSKAIIDTFDDDGLVPTEEEISCGLKAVRIFRMSHSASVRQIAANCAGL